MRSTPVYVIFTSPRLIGTIGTVSIGNNIPLIKGKLTEPIIDFSIDKIENYLILTLLYLSQFKVPKTSSIGFLYLRTPFNKEALSPLTNKTLLCSEFICIAWLLLSTFQKTIVGSS